MATDGERNILVYLVIAAALVLVIGFFAVLLPELTGDREFVGSRPELDGQAPSGSADDDGSTPDESSDPPQVDESEQGQETGDADDAAPETTEPDRDDTPPEQTGAAPPEGGETRYVVQRGDTFFDLTRRFWGDPDLWPGLYAVNNNVVSNPDLIYPGQVIQLLADAKSTDEMTRQERLSLAAGHVETYRAYIESAGALPWGSNRRAQLINAAHWVLYSAFGFDDQILERYSGEIRESDRETVEEYLERFGPPER